MNTIQWLIFFSFFLSACGPIPDKNSGKQDTPEDPPTDLKFSDTDLNQIDKLTVGSSRYDVVRALGEPEGKMNLGDTELLYYHGVEIKIQNEKVVEIPDDLLTELKESLINTQRKEKEQAAKTSVQGNQNIREGGKAVDIQALVGKGSVTIVDFYADWCGPCRQAEPHLKKMAEDPGVNLIQIDIVDWSSPVTQQYKLRSIPNMRVFDAEGKQIGKPTHSVSEIRKNIKKAM